MKEKSISLVGWIRKSWREILTAVVLVGAVYFSCSPGFRVLSDETDLISTSKSMRQNLQVKITTIALREDTGLTPLIQHMPKRPLFFPFLVSLIHFVKGYSYQNAYILNSILLFLFFLTLLKVGSQIAGYRVGLSLCFFALTVSLIPLFAMSAGFDFCAFLFFLWSLLAYVNFKKHPSAVSFLFLFSISLGFSFIRYESILPAGIFILGSVYKEKNIVNYVLRYRALYIIGLFIFIFQILHHFAVKGVDQVPEGSPVFSFSYFMAHAYNLVRTQRLVSPIWPTPHLLNILGFISFVSLLAYKKTRAFVTPSSRQILFVVFLALLAINGVYLSFYFGVYNNPTSVRFYMLLSFACVMAIPLVWIFISQKTKASLHSTLLLGLSVLLLIIYYPAAMKNEFIDQSTMNKELRFIYSFLPTLNKEKDLLVYERPGQLTVDDWSAVDYGYFSQNKEALEARKASRFVFFQYVDTASKKAFDWQSNIENIFELKELAYVRLSDLYSLRVLSTK